MSSIVVSGDTSGAVTLAAPAVAGTNTATLPAATGELSMLGGSGQTWQSVTRTSGTTYTNNTGKPIVINAWANSITTGQVALTVGGIVVATSSYNGTTGGIFVTAIVPNNTSYIITDTAVTTTKIELR